MAGRRMAIIVAAGAGLVRPMITGPGLAGPGFYSGSGAVRLGSRSSR